MEDEELPPITDEVPEDELEAEPDHIELDEEGEAVTDGGT